jgi:hypothetical protein
MRTQQQTLLWAGRILGVALALFLSLFAWDVFEVEGSFWEKVGGFLVHLTPTWLVLLAVTQSWRWTWLTGVLLVGLAGLYVPLFRVPVSAYLMLSSPALASGALFLSGWAAGKQAQLQPWSCCLATRLPVHRAFRDNRRAGRFSQPVRRKEAWRGPGRG